MAVAPAIFIAMTKIGRNAPCPCGSGLKYKRCCEGRDLAAAADKAFESMTPEQYAELRLLELIHHSVLAGVWLAFHGESSRLPGVEEMEDYYHEIYGHELDPGLIEEIAFPLSAHAMAQLKAASPLPDRDFDDSRAGDSSPASPESPTLPA